MSLTTPPHHQSTDTDEPRLAISQAQLLDIVDLNESGVIYTDADGVVRHINRSLKRMFLIDDSWDRQLTLTSLEVQLCSMLDPQETVRLPVTAMLHQLALADLESTQRLLSVIQFVLPRRTMMQISASVMACGGLVFYFRDITVEYEVDRMKSEFLVTAAHELRTPLASILGFAELLISRVMAPEKQKELLQTIYRQSKLLAKLINELLDLSRIESRQGKDFHRQQCSVDNIVKNTIRGLVVKGDKRQVTTNLPHGQLAVMVDPDKTIQALLNVLVNAFKYSPQGGPIVLDTLVRDGDGEQQVGICITDQGLGMSPDQVARMFDRFFRADPSGKIAGTGLGMSLVKEITELQDGQVQVQSNLGQGTSVTLWFPVAIDFLLSRPFMPNAD
jgi:signal transduction histidine kinase